jgi:hypothetical protein
MNLQPGKKKRTEAKRLNSLAIGLYVSMFAAVASAVLVVFSLNYGFAIEGAWFNSCVFWCAEARRLLYFWP